jgi:hypothetical protein
VPRRFISLLKEHISDGELALSVVEPDAHANTRHALLWQRLSTRFSNRLKDITAHLPSVFFLPH